MSRVFVIDSHKQPLNPVHPGRARWLLKQRKAAVFKRYPFTIILLNAVESPRVQPLRIKLDPGSLTTGIAIVSDHDGQVLFGAELAHRGRQIKKALDARRAVRHHRRARHTRYRQSRFDNRRRSNGWLAPSLMSRVYNVLTWVNRLRRLCPIAAISMEFARFDPQVMEHPDIEGCQYQQGTLAGYEVREYLLEKWARTCAYCGKRNIPLQIEHIIPLLITATGHGCRQMCLMDVAGFPRTQPKQKQFTHGFRTGDIVHASVPHHLHNAGTHVGRMSARAKGGFTIATAQGKITDVGKKYCRVLQRADGYGYSQQSSPASTFLSSLNLKA